MKRKQFDIFLLLFLTLGIMVFTEVFAAKRAFRKDYEQNESDNKLALIIGNSTYESSPLKNPVNDANDIAKVLKKQGFEVTLLTNANHKKMSRAISKFGKRLKVEGGIGFFFFAGHGMQVKGRNYLIPVESDIESEDDIEYSSIDAGRILSKMENAGNPLNMVFLDACRNNPFARSFRSGSRGLAQMDAPDGSLIVYATAPGSVASDGEGRNGIFTKNLLKHINSPNMDVEIMLRNVRKGVSEDTDGRQMPWSASSLQGSFSFNWSGDQPSTNIAGGSTSTGIAGSGGSISTDRALGTLMVDSNPTGSKIYINDIFEGNSPLNLSLPPGIYKIKVVKSDYKTEEEAIRIRADRKIELMLKLNRLIVEPSTGSLQIGSTPQSAKIYLNNKYYGKTPNTLKNLSPRNYRVTLRKKGFIAWNQQITIHEGQDEFVDASLKKPSTAWAKSFDTGYGDWLSSVQQTDDNGYILGGTAGHGSNSDIWILKLDGLSNVVWEKRYGGNGDEYLGQIRQTSDGGFIVIGNTRSFGAGDADLWIFKLNANGEIHWQKTYGGSGSDSYGDIYQTKDGGYIVTGNTNSTGAGDKDLLAFKLNPDGKIRWQKSYGGSGMDYGKSIRPTSDSGFIVLGGTKSFGAGSMDIWVLKLNASGYIRWEKTYGGRGDDAGNQIEPIGRDQFIIAGDTRSFGPGNWDGWLLKMDSFGNIKWQKAYGGRAGDVFSALSRTSDGGFVTTGWTVSFGNGYQMGVHKINSRGSLSWTKTFGEPKDDFSYAIWQTSDAGYILGGFESRTRKAESRNMFVLKLDRDGKCGNLGSYKKARAVKTSVSGKKSHARVSNSRLRSLDSNADVVETRASIRVYQAP